MATTMRAAARSAKFAKFLANRALWSQGRRTYLSAQYSCEKEWEESTKKDPLLQNVETDRLIVDVTRRVLNKTETNIGLDVDLLVHSFNNKKALSELANTLNRFRRSKYCTSALPSTSSALVRYCLKNGCEDELADYLEGRLDYGLFPDTQTLNIMLDHFLTRQMSRNAAKVAAHFMLQEDLGNEISKTLSLIACERYLTAGAEAGPWKPEPVKDKEDEEDDDDEIEYVRVPYVTNPWFDDHFDLKDPNELVGKTLAVFGRASEGVIRDSAVLIGLARWRKWDKLRVELEKVKEVSKDTAKLCLERIPYTPPPVMESNAGQENAQPKKEAEEPSEEAESTENQIPDWVEGALAKLKTNKATLFELLESEAKKLGPLEEADIKILRETFPKYVETRKAELAEKNWQIERRQRFEALKIKKRELVQREELLYAVENWNKIELILKEVEEEQGETKKEDEGYVPAQINSRHRERAKRKPF